MRSWFSSPSIRPQLPRIVLTLVIRYGSRRRTLTSDSGYMAINVERMARRVAFAP